MQRFFNTAGPCKPDLHYMLPPLARLPDVGRLIQQSGYFVIHAPRQIGKTTAMLALAQQLLASEQYVAVLLSMETGAPFIHDPGAAEAAILDNWRAHAPGRLPPEFLPPPWPEAAPGARITVGLQAWSDAVQPRGLVLFLDEIDALQDEALISVLRQLRAGYPNRPTHFPHSVALIGLRDVRDYKVASGGSARLNTASPFNILIRSLTMRGFNEAEVNQLYQQHTADSGQPFEPKAIRRAFYLTQGQPWLVNALAKIVVEELVTDLAKPITSAHINAAKELLIQRQETHLDSLAERLREPRVRRIIEPILSGQQLGDVPQDDIRFVIDLGLCTNGEGEGLRIANPIYQEILPRVLAGTALASMPRIAPIWLRPDGALDKDRLLEAFLAFWRQHGQPLLGTAHYTEIAPHLVLMAFLHRVANGCGTLEREYAIGSDRMDLCLLYGHETLGIEIKVWRAGRPDPLPDGLTQLDRYLAGLGLDTGWLVIFDQRPGLPPIAERTTVAHVETPAGRRAVVIRG